MKTNYLIAILTGLVIITGLYLLYSESGEVETPDNTTPVVDNNDTDTSQEEQDEVPTEWKRYSNPQFDFAFHYPPEGSATVEAGQVKITYLGPDNTMGSEITDGFTFYVSVVDTEENTLSEVADEQFEEDSAELSVVSEPVEVTGFSHEAYSYQLETMLGPTVTHTLIRLDNGQFVSTSYMISGDEDGTYEGYVNTMIETLEPNTGISISDEVYTETVSIAFLDLEYEGEPDRGCDQVVMVEREIPSTGAPLTGALNELFGLEETDIDGYYNFIANTNDTLTFDSATIDDGIASIYLTGELSGLAGVCDDPRTRIQIEETALQFDTVDEVELFLNAEPTDLQPSQQ